MSEDGWLAHQLDFRSIGRRLSVEIALTPWPVFIWLQSQGEYPWSRHSAEPLFAVAGQALTAFIATTLAGVFLALISARSYVERWPLIVGLSINAFLLWQYLEANAVVYL
jgi:hypothetical protein